MKNFLQKKNTKTTDLLGSYDCCIDNYIKLCCDKKLTCQEFVKIQKNNFMSKLLFDIFNRLSGIDEELKDLIIDDTNINYNINSLFGYIAKAFTHSSTVVIALKEFKDLNINQYDCTEYFNESTYVLTENFTKNEDKKYICIDFSCNYLSQLLDIIYSISFQIFQGMFSGASMSNAVIIQKYGLNTLNPNLRDQLINDLTTVKNAINSFGSQFGVLDAQDKIELVKPIKDTYTEYTKILDSALANATGLPMSYINGVLSGSLSTTGEGDKIQLDNALRAFYERNVSKYIKLLCLHLNKDFQEISFINDIVGRFTDFAQYIPNLETTTLLSENDKKTILYHAVGFSDEKLQKDLKELEKLQEDLLENNSNADTDTEE